TCALTGLATLARSQEHDEQNHGQAEEHGDGVALEVAALDAEFQGPAAGLGDEADEPDQAVDDVPVYSEEESAEPAQRLDDDVLVGLVDPVLVFDRPRQARNAPGQLVGLAAVL